MRRTARPSRAGAGPDRPRRWGWSRRPHGHCEPGPDWNRYTGGARRRAPCASGETGRRARFRFWCLRACGFESHLAHRAIPAFLRRRPRPGKAGGRRKGWHAGDRGGGRPAVEAVASQGHLARRRQEGDRRRRRGEHRRRDRIRRADRGNLLFGGLSSRDGGDRGDPPPLRDVPPRARDARAPLQSREEVPDLRRRQGPPTPPARTSARSPGRRRRSTRPASSCSTAT